MAGVSNLACVARIAAPVGVTISPSAGDGFQWAGIWRRISNVAGAGTGNTPWAVCTCPLLSGRDEAYNSAMPRASRAIAAPVISIIASIAPTSWKCTSSTLIPWTVASAFARHWNIESAISRTLGDNVEACSRVTISDRLRICGKRVSCSESTTSKREPRIPLSWKASSLNS